MIDLLRGSRRFRCRWCERRQQPIPRGVINPLMFRVGVLNAPISGHFIGVDRFRIWRGVIVDELMQRRPWSACGITCRRILPSRCTAPIAIALFPL